MALGMHLRIWSALRKIKVTTGGNLNTKALSMAEGMVNSHMKVLSQMAAYFVSPPPPMMPDSTGYS